MSVHFDTNTCQNAEPLQAISVIDIPVDALFDVSSREDEQPCVDENERARYLPNGARIISWDEGSNSVLCTDGDQWSVWLLDADGCPIRGCYYKTLRVAAFDYAERVMGYHPGIGDEEPSDLEE